MEVPNVSAEPPAVPVHVSGFLVTPGAHVDGSTLPRHWHDVPTICHVVRGRFVEYRRGHTLECRTGVTHLMPAGELHWNSFRWGDTRGVRIDIDPARLASHETLTRLLGGPLLVQGGASAQIVARVLGEMTIGDDASVLAIEGLLLELLATLARAARAQRSVEGTDAAEAPWLRRARELLDDDASAAHSLSSVALQVGVHPVTLARAWRRAYGCSLGESLRAIRIERAARALVESGQSLVEIAQAAGFYDQSHFTHAFRRQTGETPGAYRARRVGWRHGAAGAHHPSVHQ